MNLCTHADGQIIIPEGDATNTSRTGAQIPADNIMCNMLPCNSKTTTQ